MPPPNPVTLTVTVTLTLPMRLWCSVHSANLLGFLCTPNTSFHVGRMPRFSPLGETETSRAPLSMTLSGCVVKKLLNLEKNYHELTDLLGDEDVQRNPERLKEVSKERSKIEKVVARFEEYRDTECELREAKEVFQESCGDADLKEMAREEARSLKQRIEMLEEKLKVG